MKHKWLIGVFSAAFLAAVALGLGLRFSLAAKNRPAETYATFPDGTASSAPDPDVPLYTVPADDGEPETDPSTIFYEQEPRPQTSDVTPPVEVFNEQSEAPESYEPQVSDGDGDGIVHICIGGDTSVDGEFADFASSHSPDYPWGDISEIMSSADISIVNLETCVSDRGVSEKREGYGFQTPPEMLEGFKNAGIDAVNLANNHTRDFGYDALLDTFSNLKDNGIAYFGAGRDIDEAAGLTIIEKDGVKIGFTGANKVYLAADCAAGEEHAGVNQIGEIGDESTNRFIERLCEYDSQCDVLVVFLHAGTEEVFDVTTYQKEISRLFIDAGADIVVGGHSHTLQPIEFYNEKPIIYSIGNLIFWHIDDDLDGLAAVFEITVDKSGFTGLRLHPVFIKNYKANILSEGEGKYPTRYRQIIDLMNANCEKYGLRFDDAGYMSALG